MIFVIFLHFSCSIFTLLLLNSIYTSYQISKCFTIYAMSFSTMLMPTILLPQCSDPRFTTTDFNLLTNQYHSCHFETTRKDRGQRPSENCKDRLDSSESGNERTCTDSGKERTCKDRGQRPAEHCKDRPDSSESGKERTCTDSGLVKVRILASGHLAPL